MQLTLFEELDTVNPETEMIESFLREGSGFVGGRNRIYECALTNPSITDFVNFLKYEYGIGGGGRSEAPYVIHNDWHDARGIGLKWTDGVGQEKERLFNWSEIARMILGMVEKGTYKAV